jgi:hypothetical protein
MVQTANLLSGLTRSVVTHGFGFVESLEEQLRHCFKLGRHTNVVHFTSEHVTKYLWAHKDYQPWGFKLYLQCPQCGILKPWESAVHVPNGYRYVCKNRECGHAMGTQPYNFKVDRPEETGSHIVVTGDSRWLKVKM